MDDVTLSELSEAELRSIIQRMTNFYQNKFINISNKQEETQPSQKKPRWTDKTDPKPPHQPTISTQNRYEILTERSNEQEDMESEASVSTPPDDAQTKTPKINIPVAPAKQPRIPPIILNQTEKWNQTKHLIRSHNINSTKSRLVSTGIQIELQTEDDHRNLSKQMENNNIQFYTYQLRSEKKLKIVMRGITQSTTENEIVEDLKQKSYPVTKITRMKGRNGLPAPLVLLEISREYKSIYDLDECCGLMVKIESLRTRNAIIQCHRCQQFGHTQHNCRIQAKCMKCAQEHFTFECTKPTTTPPMCSNCGGEHLSTFIKCPKNPNNGLPGKFVEAPLPKTNPWLKRKEENDQKKEIQTANKQEPKNEELATSLGKMLITLNNTNATYEQKIEFIKQTEEITKMFNNRS